MRWSDEILKGYRKKPAWIYLIAAGYAAIPLVVLLQFGLEVGFSGALMKQVLFSSYFGVEALAALSGAAAVLLVTRGSFLFFVSLCFATVALKVYDLQRGALLGTWLDLGLTSFWLVAGVGFLTSTLRTPYLNPRVRWWSRDDRLRFISRGVVECEGVSFPIITLNLSVGGAFVKLDERLVSELPDCPQDGAPTTVEKRKREPEGELTLSEAQLQQACENLHLYAKKLGEQVQVRLQPAPAVGDVPVPQIYETPAEVVWIPALGTQYRFGRGLRFVDRAPGQRRWLKDYLALLAKAQESFSSD